MLNPDPSAAHRSRWDGLLFVISHIGKEEGMAERNNNPAHHRRRWLPRFGIRFLLLLMIIVAAIIVAVPWMEAIGVIAYCDYYDMGKTTSFHVPAIGSASCARCHIAKRSDVRAWVTLSPNYRLVTKLRTVDVEPMQEPHSVQ